MWYTPETIQWEKDLVSFCLNGKNISIPGTQLQGLQQYKRLLRNNMDGIMSQAFPIAYEVLNEKYWNQLIDDFHAQHKAKTPQVWKLPEEFIQFVAEQHYAKNLKLYFLNDLLYFEWIEIAVHTMEDREVRPYKGSGDLWKDVFVVNPVLDISILKYPVHLYAVKESLKHKGTYFLLTYRHPATDEVHFLDLPPLHAHFLDRIENEGISVQLILEDLMNEAEQILNINELRRNISDFIRKMQKELVLLGFVS